MLTEKQINGDNCLVYAISETETIQTFHLGMLTTNRQLPAVPLNCQYVDGRESLIMPLHQLIPVKSLLENLKGPKLEQVLQMLGNSIQTLMAYQLKPENIVFDERYIYTDSNYATVYLVYVPLKENYNEPKTALSNLLLNWMDLYMNGQGALAHPLFIQLLLKLRQESCSFRTLVDLLVKNDWQQVEPTIVERPNTNMPSYQPPQTVSPFAEKMKAPAAEKEVKVVKAAKHKTQFNLKLKGVPMWLWAPIGAGLLLSAAVGIIAPISPSSKLGACMVIMAVSAYIAQKLKEKFGHSLAVEKGTKKPQKASKNDETPKTEVSEALRETAIKEAYYRESMPKVESVPFKAPAWETGSEETVLLSEQAAKAVLMVRMDEGPCYYSIQKDVVTIGRNPSVCDLVMDETGIGRMHAEVHHNQGIYYIKDNQSLNGTYVNGKRITSNQYFQLKSGDLIKIAHREVVFS